MKKALLATFIATTLVSSAAFAANAESGGYAGIAVGQSNYDIDDASLVALATTSKRSFKPTGVKIYGGYDFSRYFAVEGGYASLGSAKATYTGVGTAVVDFKTNAFYVAAKGTAPIGDAFGVYGKLGFSRNHSSISVSSASALLTSGSENKTGILAAIGADYNVSKDFSVGLEYTSHGKIDADGDKASVISANLTFKF